MPPHATFADILSPAEHAGLLEWTIASEAALRPSTLVGDVLDPDFRRSRSLPRTENGAWQEPLRRRVTEMFPALVEATRSRPFELAEVDLKLVVFGDGDFIVPHQDTVVGARRGDKDRVLTAMYYFHSEPKGYSGGELRLYPFGATGKDGDPFVELTPRQNSLTVFPAWMLHSVAPVRCPSGRFADSRFSVICWINRAAAAQ